MGSAEPTAVPRPPDWATVLRFGEAGAVIGAVAGSLGGVALGGAFVGFILGLGFGAIYSTLSAEP